MKKAMLIAMLAGLSSATYADWSLTLKWGSEENFLNAEGNSDVYAPATLAVPTTSTWAAQILDALDSSVYVTATHPGGDSGFWDFYGQDGVAFQTVVLPVAADNRQIFTRLFNNSDPLMATMKADVGTTTFNWDTNEANPVPAPVDYDFGTVDSTDWVAIPEPGAASLLILGVGTVLARRVRSRFAPK